MEYIQTILFQIPASRLDEAMAAGGLLSDLDEHRHFLRNQTGFRDLRITRSINNEGNVLVVVETRWTDDGSLVRYETNEPNAAGLVNKHRTVLVPDSLQVLDMEALRTDATWKPSEEALEARSRVILPIAVPVGVLAFLLLVIYGLSRVYLEIQGDGAVALATGLSIGILLIAAYLASNPKVPGWQIGGIVGILAIVLAGGTIWAVANEDAAEGEHGNGAEPTASPGPGDGTPVPGEPTIVMGDNFFEFDGAQEPSITITAGEEATFVVHNEGASVHNVHVDGADGEYAEDFCEPGEGEATACTDPARVAGGGEADLVIPALDAGTYLFRCDYHPAEMTGEFVVE
jgi:plastocyanin